MSGLLIRLFDCLVVMLLRSRQAAGSAASGVSGLCILSGSSPAAPGSPGQIAAGPHW